MKVEKADDNGMCVDLDNAMFGLWNRKVADVLLQSLYMFAEEYRVWARIHGCMSGLWLSHEAQSSAL